MLLMDGEVARCFRSGLRQAKDMRCRMLLFLVLGWLDR